MEGELGLNEHHAFILKEWLLKTRQQRSERLQAVNAIIKKAKTKITDATYTKAEVLKILGELNQQLEVDMEDELVNMSHNTFLLLRQVMGQAEKNGQTLDVDFSEIEKRTLLDAVSTFEKEICEKKEKRSETILRTLEEKKTVDEVEIFDRKQLREEVAILRRILMEKANIDTATLETLKKELDSRGQTLSEVIDWSEAEKQKKEKMEVEMKKMVQKMESVMQQLSLEEEELEKKFVNTNTYLNMQKILNGKNVMIRELRQQLKSGNDEQSGDEKEE